MARAGRPTSDAYAAANRGADLFLDERIVAAWNLHQEVEPDISTERLFAMVETDTGADTDRQVQALHRAGVLKERE
jgi:hypothetical protein